MSSHAVLSSFDIITPGVPYREDHEDLQAGPEVSGPPVHRPHGEDQLEGPGPPVLPGGHGHAGLREPRVLHRKRPGGHRLHLHPPGDAHDALAFSA